MAFRNVFVISICIIFGLVLSVSHAEFLRAKNSFRNNAQKDLRDDSLTQPRKLDDVVSVGTTPSTPSILKLFGTEIPVATVIEALPIGPVVAFIGFGLNVVGAIGTAVDGMRTASESVAPIFVSVLNREYGAAGEGVKNVTDAVVDAAIGTVVDAGNNVVDGILGVGENLGEQAANLTKEINENDYIVNGVAIEGSAFVGSLQNISSGVLSIGEFGAQTVTSSVSTILDVNQFVIGNVINGTLTEETSALAKEQINDITEALNNYNDTLDYNDKISINNQELTIGEAFAMVDTVKETIRNIFSIFSIPNAIESVNSFTDKIINFDVNINESEEIDLNGQSITLGAIMNPLETISSMVGSNGDERH